MNQMLVCGFFFVVFSSLTALQVSLHHEWLASFNAGIAAYYLLFYIARAVKR